MSAKDSHLLEDFSLEHSYAARYSATSGGLNKWVLFDTCALHKCAVGNSNSSMIECAISDEIQKYKIHDSDVPRFMVSYTAIPFSNAIDIPLTRNWRQSGGGPGRTGQCLQVANRHASQASNPTFGAAADSPAESDSESDAAPASSWPVTAAARTGNGPPAQSRSRSVSIITRIIGGQPQAGPDSVTVSQSRRRPASHSARNRASAWQSATGLWLGAHGRSG